MSADGAQRADRSNQGAGQILVDLGPILTFVVSFNLLRVWRPDDAIYIATGVFMAAVVAAVAFSWFRTRRVAPVLIVTAVLVVAFGGLTLILRDENFLKIKLTIMY